MGETINGQTGGYEHESWLLSDDELLVAIVGINTQDYRRLIEAGILTEDEKVIEAALERAGNDLGYNMASALLVYGEQLVDKLMEERFGIPRMED